MKLLARFNLIFTAIFGIGTVVAVWFAYSFLRVNAKNEVLEQARLMMETTLATRSYTAQQIQPLLNKMQVHDKQFLPQTVPAYSATQVFDYLHKRNPDYTYKEATLNPTNLIDRSNDWESDVVNNFRNDAAKKEIIRGARHAHRPGTLLRAPAEYRKSRLPRMPQHSRQRAAVHDPPIRPQQRLRLEAA